MLVGTASLLLVIGLKRYAQTVSGSLIAVIAGILAVSAFDLDVAIVGEVDSGLSSFGLSDVAARDYLDLAAAAIGVMFSGFMEGLGAAMTLFIPTGGNELRRARKLHPHWTMPRLHRRRMVRRTVV